VESPGGQLTARAGDAWNTALRKQPYNELSLDYIRICVVPMSIFQKLNNLKALILTDIASDSRLYSSKKFRFESIRRQT
jgi:hypothetical protein